MKEKDDAVEAEVFEDGAAWSRWLQRHHASSPGVWMRLSKKGAPEPSVGYAQALEEALCWGWIDARKQSAGEHHWLQRWTPRGPRSLWSKVNREKATRLIDEGRMQPAGLREVERAKADGRWDRAYDSPGRSSVPPDLQAALDASPEAARFFETLNSANRYAVLWRIQTAKRADTRARRIEQCLQMLRRGETFH